jgi:hypothetical protein
MVALHWSRSCGGALVCPSGPGDKQVFQVNSPVRYHGIQEEKRLRVLTKPEQEAARD